MVTDFGLISMYGKPEGRVTPSSNGTTHTDWMAFENMDPNDYVKETNQWLISWKSDVYSFGCVCVEVRSDGVNYFHGTYSLLSLIAL